MAEIESAASPATRDAATGASQPKKMGLFKKILIGLAVIVGVFVIVVSMQPAEFRVERSITMEAPPAVAFAQVNDFRKWEAWNPWDKVDPAMEKTYEGAPEGKGAVYGWAGNGDVGEGRMTIEESRPGELVRIDMEFYKPMAGNSTAEFTFKPAGEGTQVTWSMFGKNGFIGKAMCLFMDMEDMIGPQFEKGLADMKAAAEGPVQ